jgi:hypothetical protein
MARFSLLLAHFSTNSVSLVSTFALVLPMTSFSLHLIQYSIIFISLVATVVFLQLALGEFYYVYQYLYLIGIVH